MAYTKQANLEWLELPDCHYFMENGQCALRVSVRCPGRSCGFMATQEQMKASKKQVIKRLSSLDSDTQRRIADKYYGGRQVWSKP